jgi:hypothetical protein
MVKKLTRHLPGILLLVAASFPTVYPQPLKRGSQTRIDNSARFAQGFDHRQRQGVMLVEEFSFLIKDFKMDHQTEMNNLNISISYRYVNGIANSTYPDFRLLAKDVEAFLTDYPNEDDYWEIVNKQVTSLLLKKYPEITRLTCEMKIDPTRLDPYLRSTRVTRTRPVVRSTRKRL